MLCVSLFAYVCLVFADALCKLFDLLCVCLVMFFVRVLIVVRVQKFVPWSLLVVCCLCPVVC